jgi:peptidoglycan/LPS O-acetylase OafA/YrhL
MSFVDDARSSLLYFANWNFLGASTNYFADDVNKSPFLHFWSLAIEEQFYFAFPLLLVLLTKWGEPLKKFRNIIWGIGSHYKSLPNKATPCGPTTQPTHVCISLPPVHYSQSFFFVKKIQQVLL